MERGAGNPLFLQELASVGEKAEDAEELPETVEALVATRIDQLAPGDRALLRWASVLGASFSGVAHRRGARGRLRRRGRLGGVGPARPSSSSAIRRSPEAFRFRHALIRDAAYEGLSYKRRRELHGRVAEVIERRHAERPEEAAELLSLHFFNAGRWSEAWKYSRIAGDLAREVYANVDAAQFYERALETAGRVRDLAGRRAREHVARARRGARGSGPLPASDRGAAARRHDCYEDDPVAQAEIYEARALAWTRLGSYSAPRSATRPPGCSGRVRSTSREARHAANSLLGAARADPPAAGTPTRGDRDRQRGREDAEPLGPSRALARAYSALDGGYLELGQPEKAVHEVKALEIYREIGAARWASGDRVEPRRPGVRRGALAGRDGVLHALARGARASRRRNAGGVRKREPRRGARQPGPPRRGARRCSRTRRATLRAAEHVTGSIFAETQLARLALRRGDVDAAIEDLTRVVEEAVAARQRARSRSKRGSTSPRPTPARRMRSARSTSSPRPSARSGSSRHRSRRTSRAYVRRRCS